MLIVASPACSDYNKLVKSTDYDLKYEKAVEFYEKEDYLKAETLLEELVSVFRGRDKAEKVYFYYAYTNYRLGYYTLASYHFDHFAKTYPTSEHAEECAYMNAYCYYTTSPDYSLDQTDTKIAIKKFQSFINKYPQSKRIEEANQTIDLLREKLERKAFENAQQYYHIEDYRAAIHSFENVKKDFPDSPYNEQMDYLIIKCNYLLAINSIESKQMERLDAAILAFDTFKSKYQEKSIYLKEAESIHKDVLKLKEKLNNKS